MTETSLEKLANRFAAQQKNFQQQFDGVTKQYPIVAMAFSLQQILLKEIILANAIQKLPDIKDLLNALTGSTFTEIGPQLSKCDEEWAECLLRAALSEDAPLRQKKCNEEHDRCLLESILDP